jgi:hypothetical protein
MRAMQTNRITTDKITTSLIATSLALAFAGCTGAPEPGFATPEEAVRALLRAGEDRQLAEKLLGEDGFELLRSGDEVADREDLEVVRALIAERVVIEELTDELKVARLGAQGWELPIPLQRIGDHWRFDVEAGREEILARRIGRNELSTIATLREIVDAQREYAAEGRDGEPRAFAARFYSSEGRHDGLYWPAADGEPVSPVGPLVARAAGEGYATDNDGPAPYHGYRFRLLDAQGPSAPGGARSYRDAQGLLTGGFAVIAWPTSYDNSGVMTFVVNHQGIVFERDLGPDTGKLAAAIATYDPDGAWRPCTD